MLFVIVCSNFAFSIPHRGPMSVGVRESVTERRFRQVLAGAGPALAVVVAGGGSSSAQL